MTRQITAGGLKIGGGAPVSIQSMTNTDTGDAAATIAQILELEALGCELIRVAVPDMDAVRAINKIKSGIGIPLAADIHFDHRLALEAVEAGADKLRINPGNIGGEDRVKAVAAKCRAKGVPIRVGVNSGSVSRDVLDKHGGPNERAMVDMAMSHIAMLNRYDFDDICVSLKSSSVTTTVRACRLMSERADYPLHLGVTEAGTVHMGTIKSAAGIGGLLCMGIGDTIRVSLTAHPREEIRAALDILRAAGFRNDGVNLISCPTCGRTRIDIISLAAEAERRLAHIKKPVTVAVMGCAVNGPGEARHADYGVAGGDGFGVLFKRGEIVERLDECELIDALVEMVEEGVK